MPDEPTPVTVPAAYHKAAVDMSERDRSIAMLYCLQMLCGQLHAAISILAETAAILDSRLKPTTDSLLITPTGGKVQ